jgi:hypothetical protein
MQLHLQLLFKVGCFASFTVLEPGDHGEVVAGIQGAGVCTPRAAAVSAITAGLVVELHIPNVAMFTMGL